MDADKSIAIFARQYWPTTCDASLRLRSWVDRLVMHGWAVQVITPRWHRSWPERIVVDRAVVHRIDDPPTNALRHRKFSKNVAGVLTDLHGKVDLIYCDEIDPMATAVVAKSWTQRAPSVIRFYQRASDGADRLTKPVLDVLRKTDAIIAADAHSNRRLLSLGIAKEKILRDVDATIEVVSRRDEQRIHARRVLRSVNYDLNVKHTNRVVVCLARFDTARDIVQLAKAHQFIDGHPEVRIWLIGDGPARGAIYDMLRRESVHRSVVMPGMFLSLIEVIQAADLCLIPPSFEGAEWLLPTCLRSGVSILVPKGVQLPAQAAAARAMQLCTYDPASPGDLEKGLVRWLAGQTEFHQAARQICEALPTSIDLSPLERIAFN